MRLRKKPGKEGNTGRFTKEDIIYLFTKETEAPLSITDIKHRLDISSGKSLSSVKNILDLMVKNGQLILTKGEKYAYTQKLNLIKGNVVFKKNGYAFVSDETARGSDIFVKGQDAGNAILGDSVIIRIIPDTPYYKKKKGAHKERRGRVVRIIKRNLKGFKATVKIEKSIAILSPVSPESDDRFFSDLHRFKEKDKLKTGTIVSAVLPETQDMSSRIAVIDRVLGDIESRGVEEDIILNKFNLYDSFSGETLKELEEIPENIEEVAERWGAGGDRVDLTGLPFITIDGEDAKDFDDAICLKMPGDENAPYKLFVAIADVSHFVRINSSIDSDAYKRGNSTYFPKKVYPMLPEKLSNDLCSLLPRKSRFVMVCEMDIDKHGKVVGKKIYKALIKTFGRLTYNEVYRYLSSEQDEELDSRLSSIKGMLVAMKGLADILRNKRTRAGALDFDPLYGKVILGDSGEVLGVVPEPRNFAHNLIEDFMITANCAVAEFIQEKKVPSLYRIHEKPDEDRVRDFLKILRYFNLSVSFDSLNSSKDYQKMLNRLKGTPMAPFLEQAFLRSMKIAVYSPLNIHHFGLALKSYTHFTSPIRRYADLVVHRALKWIIYSDAGDGYNGEGRPPSWLETENLKSLSNHVSRREKLSADAEREYLEFKKMQFLKQNAQTVYQGFITSVLAFGFFVGLTGFFTQGFVHVSMIADDYYEYNDHSKILKGRHTKKIFKIGDRVNVSVYSIDLLKREIDLRFIGFYDGV